jgi:hypothetical protein
VFGHGRGAGGMARSDLATVGAGGARACGVGGREIERLMHGPCYEFK